MSRLTNWIIKRAKRTPYSHISDYMERYWFFRLGRMFNNEYGLIGARVHVIKRSDDARAYHDHPWANISIVLKGGYWECTPVYENGLFSHHRKAWRGPGAVVFRRATDMHRLELSGHWDIDETNWAKQTWREAPATTLFITFPKSQSWGFFPNVASHKIYWKDYEGNIA